MLRCASNDFNFYFPEKISFQISSWTQDVFSDLFTRNSKNCSSMELTLGFSNI